MEGQSSVFVSVPPPTVKLLELADWSVIVFPFLKIEYPPIPGVKVGLSLIRHSPVSMSVSPKIVGANAWPPQKLTSLIIPLK